MLGLTMMYADSTLACARVIVSYPELCWGHSRIGFVHTADDLFQSFDVDPAVTMVEPESAAALREYLVTVDLTASIRIYADVFGANHTPTEVWLPYSAPKDRRSFVRRFRCPVVFEAPQARLYFRPETLLAKPLLANPLAFRAYERLTAQLAALLRADVDLSEQVRRLLWTTAPPPDRDAVASMLAMSARTLARKLADSGTSYAELQREVRSARAQEYLRSSDLHISEVATRLGFSDATAFSRAFRSWMGLTPSAWRRRVLRR
jgi:AraC-like DNA-binding protein